MQKVKELWANHKKTIIIAVSAIGVALGVYTWKQNSGKSNFKRKRK